MTTDITELAQSLKAAAEKASNGDWVKESGDCWEACCSANDQASGGFIIAHFVGPDAAENREFVQAANPANVLALVEALEKAHAVMNAVVTAAAIRGVRPFDGIDCDPPTLEENAEACGDAMSARIRELEANPPKPHHNGLMQISNELASAKQRIAELESLAVKLPKKNIGWDRDEEDCWNNAIDACAEVLAAAGIKVEAE